MPCRTKKHPTRPCRPRQRRSCHLLRRRTAFVLVVVAIMLPVLFGMLGIVIDAGMMMAIHRQTRNAADAAALAAAMDLVRGRSSGVATATAVTYVRDYNALPQANVTVHIPPSSGPYINDHRYAEILVGRPFATTFIQMLGVNRDQTVLGRSVAGYKPVDIGARVLTLNPDARPGLKIAGNGTYHAQFVVGSMETTGNGNITIHDGGVPYAQTEKVFLVE